MLAACLAGKLGYRSIDRDVIVEKASIYGIRQEELIESLEKAPSFWDRFRHKRYVYLTLIQAALLDELKEGKAIYHGHAGHLLLKGVDCVLRARIVAPMTFRQAIVRDRLKLDDKEAVAYIHKKDSERKKWTQYLYGVDWEDPTLYDLLLNLECIDIEGACDIISTAAGRPCFEETPEALEALADLDLASKVRANLVVTPSTTNLEVEVTSRKGIVSISGSLGSTAEMKDVETVALRVEGVKDLNLDELVFFQDV